MKKTPKPFSFTLWFPTPDAVRFWFAHFANKKIPVGIVSRAHFPQYSVWRYGVEAIGEGTLKGEDVTADMRVERSAWGFEKKFHNHKGVLLDGGSDLHKIA